MDLFKCLCSGLRGSGCLGKKLKEGSVWGFEACERVEYPEGIMVTRFNPIALSPGGET